MLKKSCVQSFPFYENWKKFFFYFFYKESVFTIQSVRLKLNNFGSLRIVTSWMKPSRQNLILINFKWSAFLALFHGKLNRSIFTRQKRISRFSFFISFRNVFYVWRLGAYHGFWILYSVLFNCISVTWAPQIQGHCSTQKMKKDV